MAFDAARARTWLAAAWIFGCAFYAYFHLSQAFLQENESALRHAFPGTASILFSDR